MTADQSAHHTPAPAPDASTTPVAVVTGASSGIGRSLAHQFVEHGYDVVVAAEDPAIEDAALELRASGRRVTAVQADLATPAGVTELYVAANQGSRPVTAVALNAGIG